ncbi:MAG: hypothetical protein OEM40_10140, partial [Acidimicrobiia bacterium]|nr:hypothetical protein [Acidimicrobiia bacterium]
MTNPLPITTAGPQRRSDRSFDRPLAALALALTLGLTATVGSACQSDSTDDAGDAATETAGGATFDLPTELNLQAGSQTDTVIGTFDEGTVVSVSEAPEGVTASIGRSGDGSTTIVFDVAADAP